MLCRWNMQANDRVRLARLCPDDADAITAAMQIRDVWRWLSAVPQPYNREDALQFIAGAGDAEYAIRVDGEFAGVLRIEGSLGIWLDPRLQGQGIALRAAVLGLSRFFQNPDNQTIGADVHIGNHASAGLLERLGFLPTGEVSIWSNGLGREVPATAQHLDRTRFAARHSIDIATKRMRINGFQPTDLPNLHRIVTNPAVARMLMVFSSDMTPEETAGFFATGSLTPPLRLVLRYKGRVIGAIGANLRDGLAVNYFLDPSMQKQGLGQEAVTAFVSELTNRFAPPKLTATVFEDNLTSTRILEKVGFQHCGNKMLYSRGRNSGATAKIYRLKATD